MSEPANAKKVRLAAEACGFETFTFERNIVKPEVLYAATTDNYAEGDVRSPEKILDGWYLRARHLKAPDRLAFEAVWAGGFHGARVVDPVGLPKELRVDYSYGVKEAQGFGYSKEYVAETSARRDAEYNDGYTIVKHKYPIATWGGLTQWIDDLIDLLKVDYPKISAKPKAPKKQKSLLDDFGKDWEG